MSQLLKRNKIYHFNLVNVDEILVSRTISKPDICHDLWIKITLYPMKGGLKTLEDLFLIWTAARLV